MLSLGDDVTSWEKQHSLWAAGRLCLSLTVPRPHRRLQGSVQRPLAPHHVARLPLPLQLGVNPVLLPPSHHGDALFFGCLSQSDAQPAVSIPQMLQAPPFEQLPQPWALAGSGQPQDELQPGQMSDCHAKLCFRAPAKHNQASFSTNPDCSAELQQLVCADT